MSVKGKKALYFAEAQHLYITELLTLEALSKRLSISVRTLHEWKTEGSWDLKKSEYIKSKTTFRSELTVFAQELLRRVNQKLINGEDVTASELQVVARLGLATDLFKDVIREETQDDKSEKPAMSKEEVINVIDGFLKGLS